MRCAYTPDEGHGGGKECQAPLPVFADTTLTYKSTTERLST